MSSDIYYLSWQDWCIAMGITTVVFFVFMYMPLTAMYGGANYGVVL